MSGRTAISRDAKGRILDEAKGLLSEGGLRRLTLRETARRAECSLATVAHHYGNAAGLLAAAFRDTVERDLERREALLRSLGAPFRSAQQLADALYLMLDDEALRRNALLIGELLVSASRYAALRAPFVDWWERFNTILVLAGPASVAEARRQLAGATMVYEIVDSAALWGRVEHRAMTLESMRRLASRAAGSPITRQAFSEALLDSPPSPLGTDAGAASVPDTRSRILSAAAEIILGEGLERATHRAIAEATGISLSSLTHHFATRTEIAREALMAVGQQILARPRYQEVISAEPAADRAALIRDLILQESGYGARPEWGRLLFGTRARFQLALAASRDDSLQDAYWQVRRIRGQTVMFHMLKRLFGLPPVDLRVPAADLSTWAAAQLMITDASFDTVRRKRAAIARQLDAALPALLPTPL